MNVQITKGVDINVRFKIYDDYILRTPVDLTQYIDLVCAITDRGHLLIEKKMSKNGITIETEINGTVQNVMVVNFTVKDTIRLRPNPVTEEKSRTIEIFGIDRNNKITRFAIGAFYLDGSGYYVNEDSK